MPKFQITPGASMETLSQEELDTTLSKHLRAWQIAARQGKEYKRFIGSANSDATGALDLRHGGDNIMGPDQSFVWSVKSVTFVGLLVNQFVSLFVNGDPVCDITLPVVGTGVGTYGYAKFGSNELVLNGGDTLRVVGAGLTASSPFRVFGRAAQVSQELIGKL
jgi:hypothetical protein